MNAIYETRVRIALIETVIYLEGLGSEVSKSEPSPTLCESTPHPVCVLHWHPSHTRIVVRTFEANAREGTFDVHAQDVHGHREVCSALSSDDSNKCRDNLAAMLKRLFVTP
jgi:hypothetical protein